MICACLCERVSVKARESYGAATGRRSSLRGGWPYQPSPGPHRGRSEPAASARSRASCQSSAPGEERVGRDGTLAMHDLADPQRRYTMLSATWYWVFSSIERTRALANVLNLA